MTTYSRPNRLLRSPWLRTIIIATMLAAWGWFLRGQLAELRRYPWHLDALPFLAGVAWGAAYFIGLGICWTLLLRTMGGAAHDVRLADGANVWLSTMLTRYIPGNVWHIVGRLALAGRLGVSVPQVLASATVEQLVTLLGGLAVFGLSLPFWRGGTGPEVWLLLLVPAGLLLLHPRVLGALLGWAAVRMGRPSLAWQYSFGEMLRVVCAVGAAKLAAGIALCVLLGGLVPVAPREFAFLIGASALAWVVGYLSFFSPSGLGVREAALTALLAQVYPLPVAIIGSLIFRLALTLGEVVAVGLSLLYVRLHPGSAPVEQADPGPSGL